MDYGHRHSETTADSFCSKLKNHTVRTFTTINTQTGLQNGTSRFRQQRLETNLMRYNKMSKPQYDLFHLIYLENYTFNDLQEYFTYSFCLIRNLSYFHQTLYSSIKKYLQRILTNLHYNLNEVSDYRTVQMAQERQPDIAFQKALFKNFGQHATKYCQLLSTIMKTYEHVEEKSQEIQKIVNFYLMYVSQLNDEPITQQVNCAELHRTIFIEKILKDDAIKGFLDNLTYILQENKFYQKSFKTAYSRLERINAIRSQKHKPAIQQTNIPQAKLVTVSSATKPIKTPIEQTAFKKPSCLDVTNDSSDLFVSPKDTTAQSISLLQNTESNGKKLKRKKKNKNKTDQQPVEYKDDVREFERKIELEFEMDRKAEKIAIEFPQDWINKLKHRLVQTLKGLH